MFGFGILDWFKIGIGAALGGFIAAGPVYLYGKAAGRQQAAVAALEASVEAYKDRNDENAHVEALDPYGLCVELGGLPDECAAELRRLGEDQPAAGNGRVPRG